MWRGRVLLLLLLVGGAELQEEGAPIKLGKVKAPVTKTPKTIIEVSAHLLVVTAKDFHWFTILPLPKNCI
jgi:hypothetical protein